MNWCKMILVLFFFFLVPLANMAYDKTGHRIIAQLAVNKLTSKANLEIENLLGKNGIVNYSNWADEIRSNHSYDYSSKWHFFNVEYQYSYTQLDSLFNTAILKKKNLIFAIDSLTQVLKSNKNDTTALKFLIHFVGDLFQPLHFGRSSDFGGNLIKIRWFNDTINLHSLWDTYMVNFEQLSYTEYSSYLLSSQDLNSQNHSLKEAFIKSYAISRKIYSYKYEKMNEYVYYYEFSIDLKESLLSGGNYLSVLLNSIYS